MIAKVLEKVSSNLINQLRDTDRTAVVSFASGYSVLQELTSDKKSACDSINRLVDVGGTDLEQGIRGGVQQFDSETAKKFMIFLTDGDGYYNEDVLEEALDKEIAIYTVGLGNEVNKALLQSIANATGGKFYYADSAEDLIEEFKKMCESIIDVYTDTDKDGISDYHEAHIRLFNGITLHTDPNNKDTDDDGLLDGEELLPVYKNSEVKNCGFSKKVYINHGTTEIDHYKMESNPLNIDSDGDGYVDEVDETRLSRVAYKDLNSYISSNYKDKNVITLMVAQPVKHTRYATDGGIVGHAFTRIDTTSNRGMYRGFYPDGISIGGKAMLDNYIGYVQSEKGYFFTGEGMNRGELKPPSSGHERESQHGWNLAVLNVTDSQSAQAAIQYVDTFNEKYNLVRRNCATFAFSVYSIGGGDMLFPTHRWTLPDVVKERIREVGYNDKVVGAFLNGYCPADLGEDIRMYAKHYLEYIENANGSMPGIILRSNE